MTTENAINPQLAEVINSNVGNKITEALASGLTATLQQLMNHIAQQAYAAGQAAAGKEAASDVVDVDAKAVG